MCGSFWIVIYERGHSRPLSYEEAEALYEIFDDARYLVKIKRQRERKVGGAGATSVLEPAGSGTCSRTEAAIGRNPGIAGSNPAAAD